jgi:hydrogenase maturation protease
VNAAFYRRHFLSITISIMDEKILFIGYGNPDRGDDGAAWHILNQLFADLKMPIPDLYTSDIVALNTKIDVWFNYQLLPEFAENIGVYQKAVFIDAHTGEIKEDLSFKKLVPAYVNSPFTHHMVPSSLLSITESITGKYPESWMLSVRGYEFEFECGLSDKTQALCTKAISLLKDNFIN